MLIRQQLVTGAAYRAGSGLNRCEFITIHETANTRVGANAQAHANLQSRGNVRVASWHWTVDDHEAIQSYRDTAICWHAGDGETGPGNTRSIGIEIAVNADGDYAQAVANAAELTRLLMARHGIPASRVVQHNHWTGKDCPDFMRAGRGGLTWARFQQLIAPPAPTPGPKPTPRKKRAMLIRITAPGRQTHLLVNLAAFPALKGVATPAEANVIANMTAAVNAGQTLLHVTAEEYDAVGVFLAR